MGVTFTFTFTLSQSAVTLVPVSTYTLPACADVCNCLPWRCWASVSFSVLHTLALSLDRETKARHSSCKGWHSRKWVHQSERVKPQLLWMIKQVHIHHKHTQIASHRCSATRTAKDTSMQNHTETGLCRAYTATPFGWQPANTQGTARNSTIREYLASPQAVNDISVQTDASLHRRAW